MAQAAHHKGDTIRLILKSQLAGNGVEVTALHNHLLRSLPATMYMHVRGHGEALGLASF